ncbi:MAG: polymer-forming cytoskeletal protein [Magnetococcales bacterium]|nr:polymer-forming cytoskeletal protein [Magnetococcales bacterium]
MAFFAKPDQPKVEQSNTTIIASGTKIKGEIEIACKLHVDGELSGVILSESLVTVGKTGIIEGEVTARKMVVTGHFVGNAECEEIEILSGGKMAGTISSRVLVIERGSFFEGESKLKSADALDEKTGKTLPAPSAVPVIQPPSNIARLDDLKNKSQTG